MNKLNTENFSGGDDTLYYYNDVHVITRLSKPVGRTTSREKPKVKYGRASPSAVTDVPSDGRC